MKKILSMILLLCAAFSVQLRAEVPTPKKSVYIYGAACYGNSWSKWYALNKITDRLYNYTGYMSAGLFRFQLQTNGNADNSIKPTTNKTAVNQTGFEKQNFWYGSYDDNNWEVTDAGYYRFTVDLDAKTLTAKYLGTELALIVGDDLDLYMIGNACDGIGFNLGTKAKLDYAGNNIYRYKGKFWAKNETYDNKFRIVTSTADWDVVAFQPGAPEWSNVELPKDAAKSAHLYEHNDRNWYFTADGYYTVDLNLNDATITAYDYMAELPSSVTPLQDGIEGTTYYATFSNIYSAMELSVAAGETLEVYNVTVEGEKLILAKRSGNKVAAGEGVLVKSTTSEITVAAINDELTPAKYGTETLLVATPGAAKEVTATEHKLYRLAYNRQADKSGLGFYWGHSEGAAINAQPNKAYLKISDVMAAQIKSFSINPQPTHVDGIEVEDSETEQAIYDISGRRVENPTKGFYIQGNKKIVVK